MFDLFTYFRISIILFHYKFSTFQGKQRGLSSKKYDQHNTLQILGQLLRLPQSLTLLINSNSFYIPIHSHSHGETENMNLLKAKKCHYRNYLRVKLSCNVILRPLQPFKVCHGTPYSLMTDKLRKWRIHMLSLILNVPKESFNN